MSPPAPQLCPVGRTGAIEFVDGTHGDEPPHPFLRPALYEREILDGLAKRFAVLKALSIGPPLIIAVTWLGVRGYRIHLAPEQGRSTHAIDRNDRFIPEIMIDEFGAADLDTIMKPALDATANACGLPGSLQYDADGV